MKTDVKLCDKNNDICLIYVERVFFYTLYLYLC